MPKAERVEVLWKLQRDVRIVSNTCKQKVAHKKASAGLQLWLPGQGQLKQVLHLTPWVTCGQAFHFVTHL